MQIIEQHLVGKHHDPERCEDAIVICDDFAAVIDGSGDRRSLRIDRISGGRFAAETITELLPLVPADATFREAADLLSEGLRERTRAALGVQPEMMPSAAFICYSQARRELWRVGDCGYLLNGVASRPTKFIDYIEAFARRALIEELLLEGRTVEEISARDPGRALVEPIVRRQYLFCNLDTDSPFAYGAIDGHHIPDRFLEIVPVQSGSELVLASDGYPQIGATLAEAEEALTHVLTEDPLRIGAHTAENGLRLGSRSFDDRAYLRLRA